jgi:hypothetical protein
MCRRDLGMKGCETEENGSNERRDVKAEERKKGKKSTFLMNIGCYGKTFRADQMLFSGIRRLSRIIVLRKEIGRFSLECWTRFFSDLDLDGFKVIYEEGIFRDFYRLEKTGFFGFFLMPLLLNETHRIAE